MQIPTEPVNRVCYADDLTVWASGVNISDLEVSINNYLEEITAYLKDNSLLISAPKCCCLPTPMALASGGSPMFPLVVHQPASPSIWPAVQSLRRGLSTNPGATMWCVCGCSLQSRCSPRTHTKPRSILEYLSRIHTCHWLNAQGYWGSIWTPLIIQQAQPVCGRESIR